MAITYDKGEDKGGGLKTSAPKKDDMGVFSQASSQESAFGYSTGLSSANDGSYNIITGSYLPELAVLFAGEF